MTEVVWALVVLQIITLGVLALLVLRVVGHLVAINERLVLASVDPEKYAEVVEDHGRSDEAEARYRELMDARAAEPKAPDEETLRQAAKRAEEMANEQLRQIGFENPQVPVGL